VDSSLERLEKLLADQPLAVVSTARDDEPYASLVAVASAGPGMLIFGTPKATRKYANIGANERLAVLLDDRANSPSDVAEAAAATALGIAVELEGDDRQLAEALLAERHPHLRDFYSSPSVAVLRVSVERWYVVTRFQSVAALGPEDWNRAE